MHIDILTSRHMTDSRRRSFLFKILKESHSRRARENAKHRDSKSPSSSLSSIPALFQPVSLSPHTFRHLLLVDLRSELIIHPEAPISSTLERCQMPASEICDVDVIPHGCPICTTGIKLVAASRGSSPSCPDSSQPMGLKYLSAVMVHSGSA